jgi:putative glutathione S-transferase
MSDYYKTDFGKDGEFLRPETKFRKKAFEAADDRYHLYVSSACPWSQRTMILRARLGLEKKIGLSVSEPVWNEAGWYFDPPEPVNGKRDVIDLYRMADPDFDDEETVPVLWDRQARTVVNNESLEICKMLIAAYAPGSDLYPESQRAEIDRVISEIYAPINNGVYQAGFARSQGAYERAVKRLFAALDVWDARLARQRFAASDSITLADICLYPTLVRFDPVYVVHFKCNLKRIADYPNLWRYLRELYQSPGFGETTDLDHIKRHYYGSHKDLNPLGIVPLGPADYEASLSAV